MTKTKYYGIFYRENSTYVLPARGVYTFYYNEDSQRFENAELWLTVDRKLEDLSKVGVPFGRFEIVECDSMGIPKPNGQDRPPRKPIDDEAIIKKLKQEELPQSSQPGLDPSDSPLLPNGEHVDHCYDPNLDNTPIHTKQPHRWGPHETDKQVPGGGWKNHEESDTLNNLSPKL